jgi:hypothetical protein
MNSVDKFTINSMVIARTWSNPKRLKRNGITDIDKKIVSTSM